MSDPYERDKHPNAFAVESSVDHPFEYAQPHTFTAVPVPGAKRRVAFAIDGALDGFYQLRDETKVKRVYTFLTAEQALQVAQQLVRAVGDLNTGDVLPLPDDLDP